MTKSVLSEFTDLKFHDKIVDKDNQKGGNMTNMLQTMADTYATNCVNHLTMNWSNFLNYTTESFCLVNDINYKKDGL